MKYWKTLSERLPSMDSDMSEEILRGHQADSDAAISDASAPPFLVHNVMWLLAR